VTPPNPLKPIQEALERVLHESGLHDFGRSMSSIDDLTAEVQHVYQRVDDIERVLETIVPILERLTIVFEEIQSDLEPMSELASKIPGSGSRRRRRDKAAAERVGLDPGTVTGRGAVGTGARPAVPSPRAAADAAGGSPVGTTPPAGDAPSAAPGAGPGASPVGGPSGGPEPPADPAGRPSSAGPGAAEPRPSGADDAGTPAPGSGKARPGATGYSPLGSRDDDR
jgi:hypothetical protein